MGHKRASHIMQAIQFKVLKSSQFNKSSSSKKVVTSRRKATTTTKAMLSSSAGPATLEGYGSCSFKGAVADKYLKEQGYDASLLKDLSWPKDEAKAKAVAAALLSWATITARSNIRTGSNRWRALAFVTVTLVACKWLCLTLTRTEFRTHRFRTKTCCKVKLMVPPTRTAG